MGMGLISSPYGIGWYWQYVVHDVHLHHGGRGLFGIGITRSAGYGVRCVWTSRSQDVRNPLNPLRSTAEARTGHKRPNNMHRWLWRFRWLHWSYVGLGRGANRQAGAPGGHAVEREALVTFSTTPPKKPKTQRTTWSVMRWTRPAVAVAVDFDLWSIAYLAN
jgi:hypothetical protein